MLHLIDRSSLSIPTSKMINYTAVDTSGAFKWLQFLHLLANAHTINGDTLLNAPLILEEVSSLKS